MTLQSGNIIVTGSNVTFSLASPTGVIMPIKSGHIIVIGSAVKMHYIKRGNRLTRQILNEISLIKSKGVESEEKAKEVNSEELIRGVAR